MATSLQEVTELYRKYAKREPDASGLAYWMKDFGDSVSPEEETSFRESLYINEPSMDPNGVSYGGPAVYPKRGTAMSSAQALDLMYKSSTTGVSTSEFDKLGGYAAVKAAAEAAGYSATPQFIQSYEIANNLPESASTKLNKQFVGPDGAARQAQLEADLNSQNAALAEQTRANLAAQSAAADAAYKQQQQAAIDKIIADRKVVAEATDAAYRRDYPAEFAADPVQQYAAKIATQNPTPAAPKTLNPIQTALAQINRPTAITQPSYTQVAPAQITNRAITGTPYSIVYSPATMQQNAPTVASIQAAAQSANPYASLMALTPQRSMPAGYAGLLGTTPANTNLGGFDPKIYNPAATGLLNTTGNGSVNDGGEGLGGGGGGSGGLPGYGAYQNQGALSAFLSNIGLTSLGQALATNLGNQLNPGLTLTGADIGGGQFSAPETSANSSTGLQGQGTESQTGLYGDAAAGSGMSTESGSGSNIGSGSGYMAKGGMVNMKPQRHNPPGPDDGYAALDNGEYVIRKSAVKKYGANIFEQINAGRIPAQRLKSLLE